LEADAAIILKVSALAVFGRAGKREDIAALNGYAESPEMRLRTAARAALKSAGGKTDFDEPTTLAP
jgi:hypothetical protein